MSNIKEDAVVETNLHIGKLWELVVFGCRVLGTLNELAALFREWNETGQNGYYADKKGDLYLGRGYDTHDCRGWTGTIAALLLIDHLY